MSAAAETRETTATILISPFLHLSSFNCCWREIW